jgi:transposase-like protein
MHQNQAVPPGKRGRKPRISESEMPLFVNEYVQPGANRSSVARKFGMSHSGGLRAVQRFLRENPDFQFSTQEKGTP